MDNYQFPSSSVEDYHLEVATDCERENSLLLHRDGIAGSTERVGVYRTISAANSFYSPYTSALREHTNRATWFDGPQFDNGQYSSTPQQSENTGYIPASGHPGAVSATLPFELEFNGGAPLVAYQPSHGSRYSDVLSTTGPVHPKATNVTLLPLGLLHSDIVPLSGSTLYSPPSNQTCIYQPSADLEPPTIGAKFRRRGPDVNSIKKRRKNVEEQDLFLCVVPGCVNVGFTTKGSLRRHITDKHSGKEHLCSVCLRAYADSPSVGRHERDKHGRRKDAE